MGRTYDRIDERLAAWIGDQPVFFVATAPLADDGHINCSPKGNRGEFVVLDETSVAYVDQTGSGVETIAHLAENGRIVVMFCAFSGPPRVVRLHGTGRAVLAGTDGFDGLSRRFPRPSGVGVRSIVMVSVERIADSCGYGVPLMTFDRHRPAMEEWAERKGPEGIRSYWAEKNAVSLDGLPGLSRQAHEEARTRTDFDSVEDLLTKVASSGPSLNTCGGADRGHMGYADFETGP